MSTTYYIVNRKRKKECEEFKKFWEEEWFPEITDKLYQFCTGTNGEIVNKDLAESISEDKMCGFSCTPLSSAVAAATGTAAESISTPTALSAPSSSAVTILFVFCFIRIT